MTKYVQICFIEMARLKLISMIQHSIQKKIIYLALSFIFIISIGENQLEL